MAEDVLSRKYDAIAKLTGAQLRERILDLRLKGLSHRKIAKLVGKSFQRVSQICAAELTRLNAKNLETTQHIVDLEIQRIDALMATHWKRRRNPDSAAIVLKAMDRRAKLLGLDQPTKSGFVGADGKLVDPPTLVVEFTDGSTAATETTPP